MKTIRKAHCFKLIATLITLLFIAPSSYADQNSSKEMHSLLNEVNHWVSQSQAAISKKDYQLLVGQVGTMQSMSRNLGVVRQVLNSGSGILTKEELATIQEQVDSLLPAYADTALKVTGEVKTLQRS